ncbi:Sina domain containing protein [Asbolus verrucosus]|uniref:Sina domain containing protein n=1 Tax=Asbolus verrucosus TaxID=1661398 RepID=A0A482VN16_ASBVE|nr:Sina domain containing protein [Asbolus verrucosus]
MQPPIPLPLIRDLKCTHCRRFVSCGPVHVAPDSSILCGRCIRFAKRTHRNYAFEALASIFYYPCHFWPQHCNKKLLWNASLDHERNCTFQSSCNVFCSQPGTFFKSERKLPTTGGINFERVPEEALEQLKCAACESYLSNGPVYIMADGKNICHRCSHSNGIPKDAIRNLAYETIATAMIFPCIYRFRGCTVWMKFERDMWEHEHQCPYGKITQRVSKKPSKGGKERGVIETHSGHIWGTITPHSALFAPPKTKNNDGKIVTQELAQIMKKKQKEDEVKSFDSQSVDSLISKASTFDSIGDNISRSMGDNVSRDNISRSQGDNVSRDNISRSLGDNISRSSSRPPTREEDRQYIPYSSSPDGYRPSISAKQSNHHEINRQQKVLRTNDDVANFLDEVPPLPTPPGYNKISFNGYYRENMVQYGRISNFEQYPQMYRYSQQHDNNLHYSASFNNPSPRSSQTPVKRTESLRVGNQELIDELKERNNKKHMKKEDNPYGHCNSLQDIVHIHDEVLANKNL